MASHIGSEGLIHIGTTLLGELKSWSLTENSNMIDTSVLSTTAQTFVAGTTSFSGSADCHLDETDAGQTSLTVGATVTIKFYYEGTTSGDKYLTGSVIVESIDRSAAMDDITSASFSFRGTGALSHATV